MDKVQKIREEVVRLKTIHSSVSLKDSKPDILAVQVCINLLSFIDSLQEEPKKCMYAQPNYTDKDRNVLCNGCEEECKYAQKEEPVSEDLETASKKWLTPKLDKSYKQYGENKMMELTKFDGYAMLDAIEFGANWQKEHLWKSADGNDLPPIDKEVIALEGLDEEPNYRVIFAHRVDPDRVIKTTIDGKPLELHPSKYGKAGWNLPNLKYWLDLELPNRK